MKLPRVTLKEHPTWGMIVAILAVGFIAAVMAASVLSGMRGAISDLKTQNHALVGAVEEVRENQDSARERGYINRSISCMTLVIDNDREFDLPSECVDPNVAAYYPPQVCEFLVGDEDCGSKVE